MQIFQIRNTRSFGLWQLNFRAFPPVILTLNEVKGKDLKVSLRFLATRFFGRFAPSE